MESRKRLTKILSIVLATVLLLSVIPIAVFASPVDVFDGAEPAPVNKNANQTAKNFYQYLWNVRKSNSIISGATSSTLYSAADAEHDYYQAIKDYYGVTPVVFAPFKPISYQIENNYLPEIVKRYEAGSVPMFHFHGVMTDYINKVEEPADLIVNYDKTNPDRDMNLYNEWTAELKMIADYLEEAEKAGIEVYIFKMFSEMNNTNKKKLFGATTAGYEAFHNVWKQVVEYFTVERGLTGILFAYSPAGFTGSKPLYPGDEYVDILSPTSYSNNSTGSIISMFGCVDYEWMKDRPRIFGFSELGPRGLDDASPIGDYKDTLNSLIYAYPETSFVVLWYENRLSLFPPGDYANNGNYNGDYFIYSPQVIVAEEMVNYRTKEPLKSSGIATFYSDENYKKSIASLSLGDYSADKLKKLSIGIEKIKSLKVLHGCAVLAYEKSDCTGSHKVYYGSNNDLSGVFNDAKSIKIIKLENLALEKDIWLENDDKSAYSLNDGTNSSWSHESEEPISITIDLGKVYNIGQMSINQAGFFDDFKYNVRDFEVYTSINGSDYTKVYRELGNMYPASDFWFNSTEARYVQVRIITPNSSTYQIEKNLLYLAEIEVYGTDSTGDYTLLPNVTSSDYTYDNLDFTFDDNDDLSDYGKEDLVVTTIDEKPKPPKIVIPEFYKYVWLIISGGILLIAAMVGAAILIVSKKKHNK